jgi:WD40 repeat protein
VQGFVVEELSEGKQLLSLKQAEVDKATSNAVTQGITEPSVSFSPDGQFVSIAGAAVWEISSGRSLALANEGVALRNLIFSPDSTRVAAIETDGVIRVVEIPSGRLVTRIPATQSEPSAHLVFSRDGRYLLRQAAGNVGSWDPTGRVWDTTKPPGHEEILKSDGRPIEAERFTADSKYAISEGEYGVVAYNLVTKSQTKFIHQDDWTRSVAISPTQPLIAIALGQRVAIWDPRTGREIAGLDHSGVASLDFSGDGAYLATRGNEGLVRVWNTSTLRELARVKATDDIGFSSDGRYVGRVAWRSEDRIKDACERLMRNLTKTEWKLHFESRRYRPTCPGLK